MRGSSVVACHVLSTSAAIEVEVDWLCVCSVCTPNAKIVTPLIANFSRRAADLHQLPQPARLAATLSTPRKPTSKWPSKRLPAYVLPLTALDSSGWGANDWTQMLRRQIVLDLSVAMGAFTVMRM